MRVLFVTQWFPPEPWRVHLEAALAFKDLGHDVEVLTGFPNWPQGKLYPGYRLKLVQREEIEGLRVTRIPLYPNHDPGGIKRAFSLVSLAVSLFILGPFVLKKADHIHVVQLPFLVLASRWLSFWWRAKVSLEVQDLWPDTLVYAGALRDGPRLKLINWICTKSYESCTKIRVISNGFRAALISRGVPEDRIIMIPNWIDPGVLDRTDPDPELMEKWNLHGKFVVMYAGAMGHAQRLKTVVDAASILVDSPQIFFLMVGDGVDRPLLEAQVKDSGLANVSFVGSFPQSEMARVYSVSSALLIHLANSPLYAITVPSKIGSCFSASKPVLAGLEGDGRKIVEDAKAGLIFKPEDPAELAQAVLHLASLTEAEREEMGARGRRAAETDLSTETQSPKMAELLR